MQYLAEGILVLRVVDVQIVCLFLASVSAPFRHLQTAHLSLDALHVYRLSDGESSPNDWLPVEERGAAVVVDASRHRQIAGRSRRVAVATNCRWTLKM